jgi:uncharacterized protein (DUF1778 family)
MTATTTRSEKIDLRLTSAAKNKLFSAAAAANRSVTDFVLESALTRADETLAERQRFNLPSEQWDAFLAALDAPPRDMPRVKRLFDAPGIFENQTDDASAQ